MPVQRSVAFCINAARFMAQIGPRTFPALLDGVPVGVLYTHMDGRSEYPSGYSKYTWMDVRIITRLGTLSTTGLSTRSGT